MALIRDLGPVANVSRGLDTDDLVSRMIAQTKAEAEHVAAKAKVDLTPMQNVSMLRKLAGIPEEEVDLLAEFHKEFDEPEPEPEEYVEPTRYFDFNVDAIPDKRVRLDSDFPGTLEPCRQEGWQMGKVSNRCVNGVICLRASDDSKRFINVSEIKTICIEQQSGSYNQGWWNVSITVGGESYLYGFYGEERANDFASKILTLMYGDLGTSCEMIDAD